MKTGIIQSFIYISVLAVYLSFSQIYFTTEYSFLLCMYIFLLSLYSVTCACMIGTMFRRSELVYIFLIYKRGTFDQNNEIL